jgi:biotin carboxyl carrier protein
MVKRYRVKVAGETYEVEVEELDGGTSSAVRRAEPIVDPEVKPVAADMAAKQPKPSGVTGEGIVSAPLPGKILSVKVQPGQKVKRGDLLLIIEAMKMENELFAGEPGTVQKIHVSPGQSVETGDLLVELTPGG